MPGNAASAVGAAALCALLLAAAAFGPWDGGLGPRLLPLCAAVWCAAALLPRRAEGGSASALAVCAALPLCAAAALHDEPQGAAARLHLLAGAACAPLAWLAAAHAANGGAAARARHAAWGAACFALPALEACIAVAGAPATGGAPHWLSFLANFSPLRVLLLQSAGQAPAPWPALVALAALAAWQFGEARRAPPQEPA